MKTVKSPKAETPVDHNERALAARTKTLVVGPYLNRHAAGGAVASRGADARIEEAVGLAAAIDLQIVGSVIANLGAVRPATFLGKGKVEEIAARIKEEEVGLAVVDCALSPVQQRNLEKEFACKVIDRTGLILEIFGRRARTKEGALQVELAHLDYQKSRLVRSWTHLERQRGGFGFVGGPGETQIETDRRLLQERILRIKAELEAVKKTRALHRASRKEVPYPVVALVGYTNAGKSTLFNRLTKADVLAADMLFATLDPTLRLLELPHGAKAILSDTVGFISDLPTMLISAFRATLEEVLAADVILHVRDISHADSDAQAGDVAGILAELGVELGAQKIIEVWNKADLMPQGAEPPAQRKGEGAPILVSALTGQGVDALLAAIEARLARGSALMSLKLDPADGAGLHWLYEHAEILSRKDERSGKVALKLRVAAQDVERVRRRFGG